MRVRATSTRVTGGGQLSLLSQALSAIRRNNGTLLMVPDAYTGVFEDSTGITPVDQLGDPIGLITDRSYGASNLGVELVAPLNFSTSWTPVQATVLSANSFSTTTGAGMSFPLAANKTYVVTTAGTTSGSAQIGTLNPGVTSTMIPNSFGTTCHIQTTATQTLLYIRNQSAGTTTLANISVREVLGNHATQATASQKPVVGQNAQGRKTISFDGTNDFLSTGITTGNEGWVCAGVTFSGAAAANETVAESGAVATVTNKGIWLFRWGQASASWLEMRIGNGTSVTTRSVSSIPLLGTSRVVEGGWDASNLIVGVDGTVSSVARTGDASPSGSVLRLGAYQAAANYLNGPMTALIYTPVLPSTADRALIRRWIGSLQGQTL